MSPASGGSRSNLLAINVSPPRWRPARSPPWTRLDATTRGAGKPDLIISDHGTEFTSNAMLAWAQSSRAAWHFIARAANESHHRVDSSRLRRGERV